MYFEILGVSIDRTFFDWWMAQTTDVQTLTIFAIFGWAILFLIFFWMGSILWVLYRSKKFTDKWEWVLLAVDIPSIFVQTHKAIEQIFAQLSGAQMGINIGQKYWMGKKQKWFSFEIISLEGYIQYIIRTEAEYRDLVEAAIFAQYPEAEITEVEDYINSVPSVYPNETHNLFAVEFGLAETYAYPIRTYPEFEYAVSKDVTHSDPMAGILENFSRIGKGENLWLQIIIEPTGNKWKEKGIELVKKIVANKKEHHSSVINFIGEIPTFLAKQLMAAWSWNFEDTGFGSAGAAEEVAGKVTDLTPGKKDIIQSIEEKITKIGFKTKIRALYIATHNVYHPNRCMDGLVGAFNQFHRPTSNAIVPYRATLTNYAFKTMRLGWIKTKFMSVYKKRKIKSGASPYILNIEELTTLWHFPLPFVKTPLIQRTQAKRGEPPMNLPIEIMERVLVKKRPQQQSTGLNVSDEDLKKAGAPPPPDLPYS